MTMFRFASRFLIAFVLATAVGIPASAQTASTYYTAPSIAALKALTARPAVVEVVDANPGIFNWSTSPCSAADDIFQVTPTSGPTGCYTRMGTPYSVGKSATTKGLLVTGNNGAPSIATQESTLGYVNIKAVLNAAGDGIADDGPAFTAAFARTDSPTIYLPPGTYRITCGTYFRADSSVSFVGAANGASTIKYDAGCTPTQDLAVWDARSGVVLRDLTIDLNNPTIPASRWSALLFFAYAGNIDGMLVDNVQIINGSDRMFLLGVAASNGYTFRNPVITNSYFSLGTAGSLQNQCIGLTTVNGAGYIKGPQILNNRCVNTAIQYDGTDGFVIGNDVSAFKFGTGIFSSYNDPVISPQSCQGSVFANNVIHDTDTGRDSNNVPFGGIENNCLNSTISGNVLYNLGGGAIVNFGRGALITNNIGWGNGKDGSGGAGGITHQGGIGLAISSLGPPFDSDDVTITGNKMWDSGSGTQAYGYVEGDGFAGRSVVRGNDFRGATQAMRIISPQTSSDVEFIATKTALTTPVASIEFTGLDTASFKQWALQCRTVIPVAAGKVGLQVGQGATPTWMTGAHYAYTQTFNNGVSVAPLSNGTDTAIWVGSANWDASQAGPGLFSFSFGDLGYALGFKIGAFSGSVLQSGGSLANVTGTGTWADDSNPITALRVVADTGNFYGACTLTGRP
jgi:hypothetical protein